MAQVAKDSGLGRESLYKALNPGAKPKYETIAALMRALNVKIEVRVEVSLVHRHRYPVIQDGSGYLILY